MENWQSMTQAQLDDDYANADYIPDAMSFPPRWAADAAAFRTRLGTRAELNIPYGPTLREQFDLFHPEGSPKGLIVFVHGGYWRRFSRTDWSHFAEGALAHGFAVAMPSYTLAPEATIPQITSQIRAAVEEAARRVPGPIGLTGHSAGGHLVARMLMADAAPGCADRIRTCVPISPVADLRPLVPQSMNDDLRLTEDDARAESPVLGQCDSAAKVTIWVGEAERPSFLWQADQLARAWNKPSVIAPDLHHFDVIDDLRDPASDLLRAILPDA